MFGTARNGANTYATVGMETGVAAANPHKLIVMLFDGAKTAVTNAMQQMKSGETEAKGQAISQAIMIINSGLRASLDKAAGGEIAASLDALYEYMSNRLLMANLNNEPAVLEEVGSLLSQLREAWEAIGTTVTTEAVPTVSVQDPIMPRVDSFVRA
ncbi:flagellar protein FliS [Sulfuriferula plumbiphila]|uniref:Flagellar secretion chaperone FliS n=1 Tax=Sulfuriferula plumbiphila TaxID=171865 RepID=A0A512L4B1_9PROT|nr:flagellar export chaperone FliS [Sulfuriferula plumbiphila]BBP03864.1 flagellar protein FliS [Sulfuriferula plumbiphila]GEP29307.1 flagellar protein FliS [Sulfuriferula plumbiphila]